MNKKRENSKPSVKRTVLTVLCVVLVILLAILIVIATMVGRYMGMINRVHGLETLPSDVIESYLSETDDPSEGFGGETIDPDQVVWGPGYEPIEKVDHIINILLIGQDRREGQGRQRSDSMILCSINTKTKTLTMTSFLRDLYVQIPGYQDNRINVCYPLGGMELLDTCIEKNFGITVDANIEVDFGGFMEVIDILGGVDINLTNAEANYLNKHGNWDVTHGETWNLTAGKNHLNGSQALAYSRIRYIDSDFSRTGRQRNVLNALLEKCKSLSWTQLLPLMERILPLLTTDMSNGQIVNYARDIFMMLSDLEIVNQRIPADGAYKLASIRGMSVLLPDLEASRKLLEETIYGNE